MIKVKQFEFSMFGVNTYIIYDTDTRDAAVVDPAMSNRSEQHAFDEYVESNALHLNQIINTHLHLDHCFGMDYVKDKYGLPVKAHSADALLGQMLDQQYMMFGMKPMGRKVEIDVPLADGDVIQIGNSQIKVIHVPGHTEGGIALYIPDAKVLLSGDTIFSGSVGRTDLPGGSQPQLIRSIREKIFTLPDDVMILSGHGRPTTVGYEHKHNPYAS